MIPIPLVAAYRLICWKIKKPAAPAELNPYSNDGFEIENINIIYTYKEKRERV